MNAFLEASPDAFVGFDSTGHIILANPLAERLLGYERRELIGRPIGVLLPALEPAKHIGFGGGESSMPISGIRLRLLARRRDRATLPVDVSLTRLGSGPDLRVLVRLSDVSDHVRTARERAELVARERETRSELEHAHLMKDEFLATLSHELRMPLNSMLGWTQILRSGTHDAKTAARALETIERNIRWQAQHADDVLDISRILSGQLRLDIRAIHVVPIIDNVVAAIAATAQQKGIALNTRIDLENEEILGDPERLKRMVGSLLANAVKFTHRGGCVEIRAQAVGSFLHITVTDTGEGIPPSSLHHVFHGFHRVGPSMTHTHGGLGVGLFIVRSVAEAHGGNVRAESPGLGKGATFILTLPVAGPPVTVYAEPTRDPWLAPARDTQTLVRDLEGVRVLVVDDEHVERESIAGLLEAHGADVITAATSAEAMRAILVARPTVLLCDVGIPEEDGYTLIRKMRALGASMGGATPAAAMTAYTRAEDRQASLEAGFQMHITMPVEPTRLVEIVAELAKAAPPLPPDR